MSANAVASSVVRGAAARVIPPAACAVARYGPMGSLGVVVSAAASTALARSILRERVRHASSAHAVSPPAPRRRDGARSVASPYLPMVVPQYEGSLVPTGQPQDVTSMGVAAGSSLKTLAAAGNAAAHLRGLDGVAITDPQAAKMPDGTWVGPGSQTGGYHGTTLFPPDVALEQGLPPRGNNLSLLDHVLGAKDSAFRGATAMPAHPQGLGGAACWAGEGGWVYHIDGVPTWDANALLAGHVVDVRGYHNNPAEGEWELMIPAHVPPERIRSWGCVTMRRLIPVVEHWESNPSYVPTKHA